MVPQELITAYAQIVQAEPDVNAAVAHLYNLLLDAEKVSKTVQEAIDAARARSTQPAQ